MTDPRKLPNGDRAIVDARKIEDYCLSVKHDDGKHKARLFRDILGVTLENSSLLVDALKKTAASDDATPGKVDRYGERYMIDFTIHGPAGTATVRSAWIVLAGETVPRLVTCYIL